MTQALRPKVPVQAVRSGVINSGILSRTISTATGIPAPYVRRVLNALSDHVGGYLSEGYDVQITGFGRFRIVSNTVKTNQLNGEFHKVAEASRVRVYFSKSRRLKGILMNSDNEEMDKYAVDETAGHTSEELEKMAAKGCPRCGKTPERHGTTLICPTHGSEPFEG